MLQKFNVRLDKLAKSEGYLDMYQLLRDYRIMPTVLTPKHKKFEFIKLLMKSRKR